jgi:hypothetical protein
LVKIKILKKINKQKDIKEKIKIKIKHPKDMKPSISNEKFNYNIGIK